MLNIKHPTGSVVADDTKASIRALDDAVAQQARMCATLIEASQESNLAIATGQPVLDALTASLRSLVESRAQLATATRRIAAIQSRSNLRETSFGCPSRLGTQSQRQSAKPCRHSGGRSIIVITLAYWIFLLASLAILSTQGGEEGRLLAAAAAIATIATFALHRLVGVLAAQSYVLLVDCLLLSVGLYLAIKSSVYWSIWFSGFMSISVATSLANMLFPTAIPSLYVDLSGFWSIPALSASVIGVCLDRRSEIAKDN